MSYAHQALRVGGLRAAVAPACAAIDASLGDLPDSTKLTARR